MVVRGKASRKHRKRHFLEEVTPQYEKGSRIATSYSNEPSAKKMRALLPIKNKSGILIQQFQEEEAVEPNDDNVAKDDQCDEDDDQGIEVPLNIQQRKTEIAKTCSNLVNDPQSNIHSIKKLLRMLWEKEPVDTCVIVRKLAMASLTCVFTDIIPGYRIRERTEDEKGVKLSKDVRSLIEFEEALLRHYQTFLDSLEKVLKNDQRHVTQPFFTKEEHREIVQLAVKSLCELYEKTSHFNFHNNITLVLMPLTNSRNKKVSEMSCNAVRSMFRSDKSGQTSLTTMRILARIIKDGCASKKGVRPEVVDTFLSLHINHVDFESMSKTGPLKLGAKEKKRAAEERKKLSRGQKKYLKRQEKLQSELKATEAVERRETKLKYHTEIIQQVFLVYFRILKQKKGQSTQRKLLNSVLEGLAQFAHLINIDFFSDLIVVLQNLVSSGDLTFRQNLCCISTAFKVLSGQGEALNIDPTEFYKHLYEALLQVINSPKKPLQNSAEKHSSDLKLILDCLNIMLNKRRKQVTLSRLSAFVKRLCALSLNLQSGNAAQSVLEVTERLLNSNSKTNALFDIDSQAKGIYMPELEDPEHCGATSACLWELHTLRRHFHPNVKSKAVQILKNAAAEIP